MIRNRTLAAIVGLGALVLLGVAVPASAVVFQVVLTNGSTFETRYQPIEDPSDPSKVMLLTETGNWIALPKAIVAKVNSDVDIKGFGLVIDSNTIAIGLTPNEAPSDDEDEFVDPATELLRYLQQQNEAAAVPYSVQQFVEPNESGGFPVGWTYGATPPIGASERFLTPQDRFSLPPPR